MAAVIEPSCDVTGSDRQARLLHRLEQGFVGTRSYFAKDVLYLAESLFNGIQIRRVGGRTLAQLPSLR